MKFFFPWWIFPTLLLISVGSVWVRLSIVKTSYEIDLTEKMISNSKVEYEQIKLKIARFRSPRFLEKLAKNKHRLYPPKASQIVRLKETRTPFFHENESQ